MKSIIVLKKVDIPNCPRLQKDQKVRVKDDLAKILVERDLAKMDPISDKKSKAVKPSKKTDDK